MNEVLGGISRLTFQMGVSTLPHPKMLHAIEILGKISLACQSDLSSPAVNKQFDTRDEARVIRRQKQRHLSNFLRFSHASHRNSGHNPRMPVLWRIAQTKENKANFLVGARRW